MFKNLFVKKDLYFIACNWKLENVEANSILEKLDSVSRLMNQNDIRNGCRIENVGYNATMINGELYNTYVIEFIGTEEFLKRIENKEICDWIVSAKKDA